MRVFSFQMIAHTDSLDLTCKVYLSETGCHENVWGGTKICVIWLMAVTSLHFVLAYSNKNEEERVRSAKQESSAEESDDQDDGEDDR